MNQSFDKEHHIVQELLGAYLLGAAEAREAELCATHLATCNTCQECKQMLEVSSHRLAGDLPSRRPSDQLKQRLMNQVRAEAELFEAARSSNTTNTDEIASSSEKTSSSLLDRTRETLSRPLPLMAGFAVVMLLLIGGSQLITTSKPGAPERQAIAAVGTGDIRATVTFQGDQATLTASKLPALGPGRVYQVWLQQAGGVLRPTDTLFTERKGSATVTLPSFGSSNKVLITSEPKGGSTKPSRSPILGIEV